MKPFLCFTGSLAVILTASLALRTTGSASGREGTRRGAIVGGWTVHKEIDTEAKAVFDRAVAELKTETKYQPLSCATQVVSGLNYAFLCTAVDAEGNGYFCVISCYLAARADAPVDLVSERIIPFREP